MILLSILNTLYKIDIRLWFVYQMSSEVSLQPLTRDVFVMNGVKTTNVARHLIPLETATSITRISARLFFPLKPDFRNIAVFGKAWFYGVRCRW